MRLRAEHEAGHGLAAMQGLARAVDDAGFHQRDHAIGAHFAVDAQILAVVESFEHGIGNAADAELQGGAIGDQRRDVARRCGADRG